jgi:phospholipid transport system substrate-binding protein
MIMKLASLPLDLLRGTLLMLSLVLTPVTAMAAQDAVDVVRETTDNMLADLKANKELYKQQPSELYVALDRIFGSVVDMQGLSRGVMTVKYSRRASPEQMERFESSFQDSLIRFYGNALLDYDNQQITILPAGGRKEPDRQAVNMEIRDAKGTVYPLSYTMVKVGDDWRVRNVVINGINIGKLFRDQFEASMRANRNDLDKVIDSWADVVSNAQQTAQAES